MRIEAKHSIRKLKRGTLSARLPLLRLQVTRLLVTSFLVVFFQFTCSLQSFAASYPKDVTAAITLAGSNRKELSKVLEHYAAHPGDSLKYRAACFLLAGMPAHESRSYYWTDSLNKVITFNEFDYPDFAAAVVEFNKIALRAKPNHVTVKKSDCVSITSEYLIKNIDEAFELKQKPWARNLTFDQFCEYLLPYRFMDETFTEWRGSFQKEYARFIPMLQGKSVRQVCVLVCDSLKKGFYNTWVTNPEKVEPAFLSPAQLLFRKQGACEDIANWGGYIFRSFGIATNIDYTPAWATSTGSHYWNVTLDERGNAIPFVMCSADSPNRYYLHREPSKVLRIIYSINKETISQRIPKAEIPEGFLQFSNYLDVTRDYWKVFDLKVKLDSIPSTESKSANNIATIAFDKAISTDNMKIQIAYVAVLNGLAWRPIWWSEITKGGATTFTDLSCGAVYLPMLYQHGTLSPAAVPQLLRKDGSVQVLTPYMTRRRTVSLAQQEGYLIFRPGKRYALYCWQGGWKQLGVKTAVDANPLVFSGVPSNALLLLVPEYSLGKERPFTIDEQGLREWW